MVENHWLAVFIETCTLGLAVGFLRITRAKCYSLRLFVTNKDHQKVCDLETAFVQWD